uniref:U34-Liphistoxin-Lth1f_1 n=1 Tax=Liphistius thaleban TaxID=1905330 RepID=A0A4Q8K5W3_9ARAC
MKYITFAIVCFLLLVEVMEIHAAVSSFNFEGISDGDNIQGNGLLRKKRSCIPRNQYCDRKRHNCCYGSTCRCNPKGIDCSCKRRRSGK